MEEADLVGGEAEEDGARTFDDLFRGVLGGGEVGGYHVGVVEQLRLWAPELDLAVRVDALSSDMDTYPWA